MEMDVGRYAPASSPVVLFVLRTLARVEGFIYLVLGEGAGGEDGGGEGGGGGGAGLPLGICGFGAGGEPPEYYSVAVAPSTEARSVLASSWRRVASQLSSRAVPMLKTWVARAVDEVDLGLACGLHAHLVLLFKNARMLSPIEPETLSVPPALCCRCCVLLPALSRSSVRYRVEQPARARARDTACRSRRDGAPLCRTALQGRERLREPARRAQAKRRRPGRRARRARLRRPLRQAAGAADRLPAARAETLIEPPS